MAEQLVPDEVWSVIQPLLPPKPAGQGAGLRQQRDLPGGCCASEGSPRGSPRRGVESNTRLDRQRWQVERSHAWLLRSG